jgi:electron transport complex protein RnfD
MIIPLMMPVTVTAAPLICADVFAICVVKAAFGGTGRNVFNPAAGAFAFTAVCFPAVMFSFPPPMTRLAVFNPDLSAVPMMSALKPDAASRSSHDIIDIVLGNTAGPMGTANILVIGACLLYLLLRGAASVWTVVPCLVTSLGVFALYGFVKGEDLIVFIGISLVYGSFMFAAAFLVNDPVTSPKRPLPKFVYGAVSGIVMAVFSLFGAMGAGAIFAILIMNSSSWGLDILAERYYYRTRRLAVSREKQQYAG